jgi:hypothetical protein
MKGVTDGQNSHRVLGHSNMKSSEMAINHECFCSAVFLISLTKGAGSSTVVLNHKSKLGDIHTMSNQIGPASGVEISVREVLAETCG